MMVSMVKVYKFYIENEMSLDSELGQKPLKQHKADQNGEDLSRALFSTGRAGNKSVSQLDSLGCASRIALISFSNVLI